MAALVFRLTISTDNAAFEGEQRNHETARILRVIAQHLEDGDDCSMFQTIFDVNGNDVGRYAFKPAETMAPRTRSSAAARAQRRGRGSRS